MTLLPGYSEAVVVPVQWPQPTYPQIAQSARVGGDVEVAVDVRSDGSVAAAEAIAGPPLLREASENAARRTRFECRGCASGVVRYSLYVTYRILPNEAREVMRQAPLVVSPTQGWITVDTASRADELHIRFEWMSVRAPKCLYLWRCGSEWGGMSYWNDPVRTGRCLWLWSCGWKRAAWREASRPDESL